MDVTDFKLGERLYYVEKIFGRNLKAARLRTDSDGTRWKEVFPPTWRYRWVEAQLVRAITYKREYAIDWGGNPKIPDDDDPQDEYLLKLLSCSEGNIREWDTVYIGWENDLVFEDKIVYFRSQNEAITYMDKMNVALSEKV